DDLPPRHHGREFTAHGGTLTRQRAASSPFAVSIAVGSSTCTTRKPAASALRTARSTSAAVVIPARSAPSLIRRNRPDRLRVVAYRAAMKRAASSRASSVAIIAVSTPRL